MCEGIGKSAKIADADIANKQSMYLDHKVLPVRFDRIDTAMVVTIDQILLTKKFAQD